ncbi:MAG: hypothetical protein JWQ34_2478 [Mucilaginibacter sp.]|nr:hypothetical protein [Mucilaginibacter sp.]
MLLTGCLKTNIAPISSKSNISTIKADTLNSNIKNNNTNLTKADTLNTYDWYNGTKGTALIQVICNDCNAIATIGNVTTPFLFNEQGVGQLKYTPASDLLIHIAVCPGSVKIIKADIFDAKKALIYTYSGVSGNWNDTYIIK